MSRYSVVVVGTVDDQITALLNIRCSQVRWNLFDVLLPFSAVVQTPERRSSCHWLICRRTVRIGRAICRRLVGTMPLNRSFSPRCTELRSRSSPLWCHILRKYRRLAVRNNCIGCRWAAPLAAVWLTNYSRSGWIVTDLVGGLVIGCCVVVGGATGVIFTVSDTTSLQ